MGADWFTATETSAGKGTWSLTLPADVSNLVSPIFGNNLFDQLALSVKACDNLAAYDFSAPPA